MRGFWRGAAALSVLAAAGWLTAGLPVLPIHLRLKEAAELFKLHFKKTEVTNVTRVL